MDLEFLSQADAVALNLEKAKRALELAKADLETAKQEYDELFSRADEHGIPKAKLKKLTEDRVLALIEAGMTGLETKQTTAPVIKTDRPKKTKKKESRDDSDRASDSEIGELDFIDQEALSESEGLSANH